MKVVPRHRNYQNRPVVTVFTDLEITNGSSLDEQLIVNYHRGTTMAGFRTMVKDMELTLSTRILWLVVGNCQIPLSLHVSPVSQMKKLVNTILKVYPLTVHKIYVGAVLPRADREAELETDVIEMNSGLARAVNELKRHHHTGQRVEFVPLHKLFLERYKFIDLITGKMASLVRVRRPLDRYFIPGTMKLNLVGKYHLKSFLLQEAGVVMDINSWRGVPNIIEPREMQDQKRLAWIMAHASPERSVLGEVDVDTSGTDVEDEREGRPGRRGAERHWKFGTGGGAPCPA